VSRSRLRERWIGWRNERLADPHFQSWLARNPLTRPIVRRKAAHMFGMVTGFVYSQVLAACVAVDLFATLRAGPMDAKAFAQHADLPEAGAERLLKAAASLDLAEDLGDGRFALGQQGAALLGNPGVAAMIRHHALLYGDLADPLALLRAGKGKLGDYWAYGQADPEAVAEYSALMAASQPMVAEQVLAAHDFGRHRHLLDVGGGEGAFLAAVGRAHPALRRTLFDLPAVAERARDRLGVGVEIVGGSFLTDPIPRGADIVSLVRILHDHDDAPAQTLLNAIAESLIDGGKLLIAEPMAGTSGALPMGEAYFGLYLTAMGSGRPRTPGETGAMLQTAGFRHWKEVRTRLPLLTRIIVATR
jgi:demethylspheroidene O-methyltransferase